MSKRDFGADIVRIAAGILVLVLHFYLRNGFYYREVTDYWGFFALIGRSISLCCVPMFVVLTGYLKCQKEWSGSYYRSLVPILISYVLISILHLFYKIFYEGGHMSAGQWILQFTDFQLATYGWYVGMYIGLFLLSPLLNRIWNSCRTHREHLGVVLTLTAVTFIPAAVNTILAVEEKLLPAYFTKMYYISYYFIGCYIRTYRPKVKRSLLMLMILTISVCITVVNLCTRTKAADFYTGYSPSYDHLLTAIMTTCMFLLLYSFDTKREWVKRAAARISGGIFEMYLMSYMFDRVIYGLYPKQGAMSAYLTKGLWMVTAVFVLSWVTGMGVHVVSVWIAKQIGKVQGRG